MFLQCSLGKKRMKHGPKDWHLKICDWVGISGVFVLKVRVKVCGFLLSLDAGVLFKLELYSLPGFLSRLMQPVSGGNSDLI